MDQLNYVDRILSVDEESREARKQLQSMKQQVRLPIDLNSILFYVKLAMCTCLKFILALSHQEGRTAQN